MPYVLIGAGLFSMLGAAMNWDWFMNSRKAATFVRLFGRQGARLFYLLLGLALVVGGVGFATGLIPEQV